jgi:hypothetical protein
MSIALISHNGVVTIYILVLFLSLDNLNETIFGKTGKNTAETIYGAIGFVQVRLFHDNTIAYQGSTCLP